MTDDDSRDDGPWVPPAAIAIPIDGVLDLHVFSPRDLRTLIPDYLHECQARGILAVRLIHGRGIGAVQRSVHALLERSPLVRCFRLADGDAGGRGATIVDLCPFEPSAATGPKDAAAGCSSPGAVRRGPPRPQRAIETAFICAAGGPAMATKGVCVVVGVGPGIGQAVARRFGAAGHPVALVARRKDPLDAFARTLADDAITARAFVADVENAGSLKDALAAIEHDLGAVDVLVYNAAVLRPGSPFEVGVEQLVRDFRVNVGGALVAAQAVAGSMKQRRHGTILFTGGGLALDPWPQMTSLAVGKAGIRNLAHSLHKDLKPHGIRVATVTVAGLVQPGAGPLDPAAIADVFFALHEQPVDGGEVERVVAA
jgi:NADP-dependent 3-hydroxy acid dehydrogenase YdfG